jgi:hypothetical protein
MCLHTYIDCVKPLEGRLVKVQPLKEGARIGRGTGTNGGKKKD